MADFNAEYSKIYRYAWDLHRKYHGCGQASPDGIWGDLAAEMGAWLRENTPGGSLFAGAVLAAVLEELARVKHRGLPPNSCSEPGPCREPGA